MRSGPFLVRVSERCAQPVPKWLFRGGSAATFQEDASRIPQPNAIACPVIEPNVSRHCISPLQNPSRLPGSCRTFADQFNALVLGKIADNLGKYPRNRLEFSRPVSLIVRPCEPGSGVRFPLGWHPIARRGRNNFAWNGLSFSSSGRWRHSSPTF